MTWTRIATIDDVHAEVVRVVLSDAGIVARFHPVQARVHLNVPPLVARPQLDVEVDDSRRQPALELLAEFARTGEEAALAEAEGTASREPPPAHGSLLRRGVRWLLGDPQSGGDDNGP